MKRVQTEPTEDAESIALAKWLTKTGLAFTHVPNGKHRTEIEGKLLQRMGVQAGFPDYLIFAKPRRIAPHAVGVALELKKRKGGRTRGNQSVWLMALGELGWLGTVAEGAQQAVAWLSRAYGIVLPHPLPMPELALFLPPEIDERKRLLPGARCGVAHQWAWSGERSHIIATCDLAPGHEHEPDGDPEHYAAGLGPFVEAT